MNLFEAKAIKKILVPTDFSTAANSAAEYAALIGKSTGARIILLHVNELPALVTNEQAIATDFNKIDKEIKENLEKQKNKLVAEHGVTVECHTVLGLAIPEIKDEVEREKVDVVIMGTKGAHGWKELLVGSQTGKVLEKCECPVLVLPEKASFFFNNFQINSLRYL